MSDDTLTGNQRCWLCTVLNAVVGLLVGWVPVAAAVVRTDSVHLAGTLVWGVAVTLATVYRLFEVVSTLCRVRREAVGPSRPYRPRVHV